MVPRIRAWWADLANADRGIVIVLPAIIIAATVASIVWF